MDTKIIFIVDDEEHFRETLCGILLNQGYTPTAVATGQAALDRLQEQMPAVALIDLKLEDMDGLDVLAAIKTRVPSTECIVLTGHASQASAIEALNLGAYGYLQKPCDIEQLLLVIHRAIEKRKAEKALEEKERYFRALLYNLHEDILVIDREYRITDLNNTFLVTTGHKREDVIGRRCFEVSHGYNTPCDACGEECRLREVFATGEPCNCHHVHTHLDGSKAHVDILLSPFKDEEGNVIRVVEAVRDVTDLMQVEQALRRERDMAQRYLDIAGVILVVLNNKGEITLINRKGCEILGHEHEALVGKNWFDLCLPEKDREKVKAVFAKLMLGEAKPVEYYENPILTQGGQERIIAWHNTPLKDATGKITGTLSSGEDITERKRAAEALREYSVRLEEMVKERTRELQVTQEQLVRREKLAVLGRLAGGVGHELRNPLGVISNAAYYLKTILSPDAGETVQEYLDIICAEVHNATKIVSDLLDLARTQSAEREEITVATLVARALQKHPPPAEVQVSTEIAADLSAVFVDPRQIELVLVNLVVNAYQAMPEGGKLTIHAQAEETQVAVSITDTGSGIPEQDISKLFEPLFTTKARGIGLGLAISKNLTETNGGSIAVESKAGKGSTFTVMLPTAIDVSSP
jgi:PAS domain S-box-containing protein